MGQKVGISQRELSRITCEWGRDLRTHGLVYPVFARDYKVVGILAYSLGFEPLWYGEAPTHVGKGGLRFKAAFRESEPLPITKTAPGLFQDLFLCDPWDVVTAGMQGYAREGERATPTNVFGQIFQGRPIADALFEPALHRLRAIVLRLGTFRRRTLSVLAMPALAETMRPPERVKAGRLRWPWVRGD